MTIEDQVAAILAVVSAPPAAVTVDLSPVLAAVADLKASLPVAPAPVDLTPVLTAIADVRAQLDATAVPAPVVVPPTDTTVTS